MNFSGTKEENFMHLFTYSSIHLSMQVPGTVVVCWVGEGKAVLAVVEYLDKARSWEWILEVWWVEEQVETVIGPNLVLVWVQSNPRPGISLRNHFIGWILSRETNGDSLIFLRVSSFYASCSTPCWPRD